MLSGAMCSQLITQLSCAMCSQLNTQLLGIFRCLYIRLSGAAFRYQYFGLTGAMCPHLKYIAVRYCQVPIYKAVRCRMLITEYSAVGYFHVPIC